MCFVKRYCSLRWSVIAISGHLFASHTQSGSVSLVEAQGPRSRCQALTEEAQTLCFLQFSSLLGPKVPRVDLLGSLWIFYQRKARRVYSQKPSNRIGYSGVFCDILRLFDGYCWKSDEDLTEGLRDDRVREILQKNSKSLPFPYFNFSFLFFFQKIDERLNEIRRSQSRVPQKVSISRTLS